MWQPVKFSDIKEGGTEVKEAKRHRMDGARTTSRPKEGNFNANRGSTLLKAYVLSTVLYRIESWKPGTPVQEASKHLKCGVLEIAES